MNINDLIIAIREPNSPDALKDEQIADLCDALSARFKEDAKTLKNTLHEGTTDEQNDDRRLIKNFENAAGFLDAVKMNYTWL